MKFVYDLNLMVWCSFQRKGLVDYPWRPLLDRWRPRLYHKGGTLRTTYVAAHEEGNLLQGKNRDSHHASLFLEIFGV